MAVHRRTAVATPVTTGTFTSDSAGRQVESTDRDGKSTRTKYDLATGLVSEIFDANVVPLDTNPSSRFDYDSAGNRVRIVDDNDNVTQWTFDALGRTTSETIKIQEQAAVVTTSRQWVYGGLVTNYTDRDGRKTITTSDPEDRTVVVQWKKPVSGSDVLDRVFTSLFNEAGQLQSASEYAPTSVPFVGPKISDVFLEYNGLGQVTEEWTDFVFDGVQAPSQRVSTSYNSVGTVNQQRLYLDSLKAAGFSPDRNPLDDRQFSTTITDIDALGRVIGIQQDTNQAFGGVWSNPSSAPKDKTIKFRYNSDGTRSQIVRLEHLGYSEVPSNEQRGFTTYQYFANGQMDYLGHRTNNQQPGPLIADYDFDYDPATGNATNNVYSYWNGQGGQQLELRPGYDYDDIRQLKSEVVNDVSASTRTYYKYDDNGNRIGVNPSALDAADGTTTLANRLTENDKYLYTYDREGNLSERNYKVPSTGGVIKDVYSWDNRNRLVQVESFDPSNTVLKRVKFAYDPLDRWIAREVTEFNASGAQTSRTAEGSVWRDGGVAVDFNMVASDSTFAMVTRQYLNGPGGGELLAIDDVTMVGAKTVWTYPNTVGSIESYATFDTSGVATVQHRLADSFGNPTRTLGVSQNPNLGILDSSINVWIGNRSDSATGLFETQAGWYDAQSARTLSDTGGLNGYKVSPPEPARPPARAAESARSAAKSRFHWSEIEGPAVFADYGAFTYGLLDSLTAGHLDDVLGTQGARSEAAQNGYYYAGLGVGIAGQIVAGIATGGVTLAGSGARIYAAAKAYQVYAVATDIVSVNDSIQAYRSGDFTPLHLLGFAPTVGWAASAYRGLRGASRAVVSIDGIDAIGDGRRVSGHSYKGAKKLSRRELQAYDYQANAIGVKIVRNADELLDKHGKPGWRAGAGFVAADATIYLRRGATDAQAFHELAHARQWHDLGPTAYKGLGTMNRELHVYLEIMRETVRNPSRFNAKEIDAAHNYFHDDILSDFYNGGID